MSIDRARCRPAIVDAAAELITLIRVAAAGRGLVDLPASPRHHRGSGQPVDPAVLDQALLLVLIQHDRISAAGGETAIARAVATAAADALSRAILHPRDWPAAASRLRGLNADARRRKPG